MSFFISNMILQTPKLFYIPIFILFLIIVGNAGIISNFIQPDLREMKNQCTEHLKGVTQVSQQEMGTFGKRPISYRDIILYEIFFTNLKVIKTIKTDGPNYNSANVADLRQIEDYVTENAKRTRLKRKVVEPSSLWPNTTIPYTIGSPEPDLASVTMGIDHWEENTCIRFVRVDNSSEAHIKFQKLEGCRSFVGRQEEPGQTVSIGDNCNKLGIVVHEIGHALGFYHEIRRPDRDDHVVINTANIDEEELFNFNQLHWLDVEIPYDLSSVMHYRSLEWSKNGRTTVATRDPMLQGIIGVWKGKEGYSLGLSHRDKLIANTVYGCIKMWLSTCDVPKDLCEGEGYLGPSCKCVCPPGQTGSKCEKKIGTYYDHLKSPCSQEITHETIISSPHYPQNYDADMWCTYRIDAGQCQLPVLTVLDFQLGPRDSMDQCFYDFLEIRHESPYDGVMKCGSEITPGDTFHSKRNQMTVFFKAEDGGFRGFKARITFEEEKGCCRTRKNGTEFHIMSPNFPSKSKEPFKCIVDLKPKSPSKLKVVNVNYNKERKRQHSQKRSRYLPLPCELLLCQANRPCESRCEMDRLSQSFEVVLPNSGSVHLFSSFSYLLKEPTHIIFTMESSPCHKVIEVTQKNSVGQFRVGPLKDDDENLQCEWWISVPKGYHVKLRVERLYMNSNNSRDTYLTFNEIGDPAYAADTSRTFKSVEEVPEFIVSVNEALNLVIQGDFSTHAVFTYELYSCFDQHEECKFWSSIGECENNSEWMLEFCKQSCFQCEFPIDCSDQQEDCPYWAENDQCNENEVYMKINCPKSCSYCEPCADQNPACETWKTLGHCSSNSAYMEVFCRKTCEFCNDAKAEQVDEDSNHTSKAGQVDEESNYTVKAGQVDEESNYTIKAGQVDEESSHTTKAEQVDEESNHTSKAGEVDEESNYTIKAGQVEEETNHTTKAKQVDEESNHTAKAKQVDEESNYTTKAKQVDEESNYTTSSKGENSNESLVKQRRFPSTTSKMEIIGSILDANKLKRNGNVSRKSISNARRRSFLKKKLTRKLQKWENITGRKKKNKKYQLDTSQEIIKNSVSSNTLRSDNSRKAKFALKLIKEIKANAKFSDKNSRRNINNSKNICRFFLRKNSLKYPSKFKKEKQKNYLKCVLRENLKIEEDMRENGTYLKSPNLGVKRKNVPVRKRLASVRKWRNKHSKLKLSKELKHQRLGFLSSDFRNSILPLYPEKPGYQLFTPKKKNKRIHFLNKRLHLKKLRHFKNFSTSFKMQDKVNLRTSNRKLLKKLRKTQRKREKVSKLGRKFSKFKSKMSKKSRNEPNLRVKTLKNAKFPLTKRERKISSLTMSMKRKRIKLRKLLSGIPKNRRLQRNNKMNTTT